MQFKKNIKRKFHIKEMVDPWALNPIYEILLKKDADILGNTIYALRNNFTFIDNAQKMEIFFEAFKVFLLFIDECKKRDLFYE